MTINDLTSKYSLTIYFIPCWSLLSLFRLRILVGNRSLCSFVHSLGCYTPTFSKCDTKQSCPVPSLKLIRASFLGFCFCFVPLLVNILTLLHVGLIRSFLLELIGHFVLNNFFERKKWMILIFCWCAISFLFLASMSAFSLLSDMGWDALDHNCFLKSW